MPHTSQPSTLDNRSHFHATSYFDSSTNPSFEYVPSLSLSHTPTLSSVSTSTTFTTSPFQADQKHITIPERHTPINMFPATDFRLKRLKKSPLPFHIYKAILQLDHNTSPKSSSTTTTTKPPPRNSEITQKTQSTSINTPSTITVATTTTTTNHSISTSYTSTTANITTTTNTSTQTDTPIPALMQLNIPHLIQDPHHLSPYPAGSPAVGTLGGSPAIRTTTKKGHYHLEFLKTPCTKGTDKDAHSTHTRNKK